jgi:hypothetical protein
MITDDELLQAVKRRPSVGNVIEPQTLPPGSFAELAWLLGQSTLYQGLDRFQNPDNLKQACIQSHLPDGRSARLVLFSSFDVNAIVIPTPCGYVCGLYDGIILTLPSVVISLWSNSKFAPWIGDTARLKLALTGNIVFPAGFEFIQTVARYEDKSLALEAAARTMAAMKPDYIQRWYCLCPVRRAGAMRTMKYAFAIVWLHEFAHIGLGHPDILNEVMGYEDLSEAESLPSKNEALSQRLEVNADQMSLGQLFANATSPLHNRETVLHDDPALPVEESIPVVALAAAIVATMLHARRMYAASEGGKSHPPLWVRTRLIPFIATEVFLGHLSWDAASADIRAFAVNASRKMYDIIQSFTETHSSLKGWIGPVYDADANERLATYMTDLRERTKHWDDLIGTHANRHPIRMRDKDVRTI